VKTVVSLRTIKVDHAKTNAEYDIIVERGVDDLEWIGPAGATRIDVRYKGASTGLAPAISFADPHPSGDPNRKIFYATKHSNAWVKQARVGNGVEIEYEIEIIEGKKSRVIDPFVKILP